MNLQESQDELIRKRNRRRWRIAVLAVLTLVLFGLLFVQSAFDTLRWFRPTSASETLILYALSTINLLAFIVLLMVLIRNIIKLRREQVRAKLGAKFKTRLVKYSIALSLLPVIFLFFATSGLINRSVEKWFSEPAREMVINARQIQRVYVEGELADLQQLAMTMARLMARTEDDQLNDALASELKTQQLSLAQVFDQDALIAEQSKSKLSLSGKDFQTIWESARAKTRQGKLFAEMINGVEDKSYLIASAKIPKLGARSLVIAQEVPQEITDRIKRIDKLEAAYDALKRDQNTVKNSALLTLGLITLLTLFIAFWLALYLARTVADPVQQLAEATEHVRQGDLGFRAKVVGDDELAALALSFNEMTSELGENRRRLELSAEELQQSNAALDERRGYIEAILQSLSAGVISLDENGNVTTLNEAARELLRIGEQPVTGVALEALLPEEQREELWRMIRRAARLRSITREVHFTLANNAQLDAAVTVTALQDPRGQSRGAVIVIEDLTELIEAQRRAAWSEVARRMAHEIKNPLTPIRLSAERLAKNLLGGANGSAYNTGNLTPRLNERQTNLVRECTSMIGDEVATLQRMVDEFSNFARLPNAKLEPVLLNEVIANALKLYDERLDGIRLEHHLADNLPPVMLDAEQIKRVLVNLVDNAVEAFTASQNGDRRIIVTTREVAERDSVELTIADNGPGISATDRERIFDPYFSTKKRGTGLGLAIVSRIVAEHQGRIRVQENYPRGARFVIELPQSKDM